ncbi:Indoleamine 2,3-dioxygenase [Psilocybe cubensis]|uniref:Indoleamine 2,3-dioxygenase n=2 Tax=Psilocybe cubensis TaxID=181762 RepID=A0A8H7Y1N2_PSICU|nr:Indoleamine 2,3-dioxygenase [Psilocybe cubensis]KAH9481098.1 Indoleamine 2,3-dioxygenase [Psilocybe cubensis]
MSVEVERLKSSISVTPIFDVDQRTGFMAPDPPIPRLPTAWEPWEAALDAAVQAKLQLGDKIGLTNLEKTTSSRWRESVRQLPVLATEELSNSAILLRRAHLVLAYILHFYVQSLPLTAEILIPESIGVPLLEVSSKLDIPPLLTFSDTVLYNWRFRDEESAEDSVPTPDNIRSQTLFTNLVDEEEFYLCSARIELRGVEILELMRVTMDETFVGDVIAVSRIKEYLKTIARVIGELKALLMSVKQGCDPDVYYNKVRPWFRGEDSAETTRKWNFEGLDKHPHLKLPTELSGPSAGQSSMVHVLDVFLGVDHQATSPGKPSFMSRMQSYMPRNHRLFLDHLKANPRPLRAFVVDANNAELLSAYNQAVMSLKEFRDAHMIIATLYILGPARRASKLANDIAEHDSTTKSRAPVGWTPVKGTGGTELVKFLKDTRTRTSESLIH